MNNRHTINIICFFILLLSVSVMPSCTKKLELPDIQSSKKITLIGELVANDSFYIRVGQSVPMSKNSSMYFELLQNAQVSITGSNQQTVNPVAQAELLSGQAYTIPFSSAEKIQHSQVYTIKVNHAELGEAQATIAVPSPFTASILDTANIRHSSADALQVDVAITDNPEMENFYVIEVLKQLVKVKRQIFFKNQWLDIDVFENKITYDSLLTSGVVIQKKSDTTYHRVYTRQGIYTNDIQTENVKDGDIYAMNKRILLKDALFNGQTYTTRVIIRKEVNEFAEEMQKGVVQIIVKSVPKEYFEFLKAYEQYDPTAGFNSLAPPIKLKGNIQNGLGMVGAAYEQRFSYWFDRWDF